MSFIETRGLLAKLLATENLKITHDPKAECAHFDVQSREMILPVWKTDSEYVYNLLASHEVGHALHTPVDFGEKLDALKINTSIANVVEDVRVEKKIQRKFPGLRKDYAKGYQELDAADSFEIRNKNINELHFIDRLNIHSKLGAAKMVPFDAEERELVSKVNACETYEDVLRVSKEIQDFLIDRNEDLPPEMQYQYVPGEGQSGGQGEEGDGEGDDDGEGNGDGDADSGDKISRGMKGGMGTKNDLNPGLFKSQTQRSFDTKTDNMQASAKSMTVTYLDSPTYKSKEFLYDINRFRDSMMQNEVSWMLTNKRSKDTYRQFMLDTRREVNHMVQQFEMRKSAAAYARVQVNKTGTLNTAELHNYKIYDDIFLRQEEVPNGKSHGMIMLLDWSHSMNSIAFKTIKQILVLVQFCRKVNIPYRVYTFTSGSPHCSIPRGNHTNQPSENFSQVVEVLNSSSPRRKLDEDMFNFYMVGDSMQNRHQVNRLMGMGGTPLSNTMFLTHTLIREFKEQTNVDKISYVVVTDGDSGNLVYHDKRGGNESVNSGGCARLLIRNRDSSTFEINTESRKTPGSISRWIESTLPYVNASHIYLGDSQEAQGVYSSLNDIPKQKFDSKEFSLNGGTHFKTQKNWPLVAIVSPAIFNDSPAELVLKRGDPKASLEQHMNKKKGAKKVLTEIVSSFA